MMNETEINRLLEQLGLTEYEAKTLNTLFKLKEAEAPEVSSRAQVPKTRVYDVLDRLTKKNLIIEISGRPKKYKVVDPGKVFDELLGKKREELGQLEKKAGDARGTIASENGFDRDKGERVMKVKDKRDFVKIVSQEISTAKNSVIGFTNLAKEYAPVRDSLKSVSGKNIEIRLIGKMTGAEELAKELSESNVKMRHFDQGMHAYVIDGKRVILALSDLETQRPEYHFTIWNDNKTMVSALGSYFDQCWEKGRPVKT